MKIITAPSEFKALELKCSNCDAQLLADKIEDFVRNHYSDPRETWDYAETTCPCCKTRLEVSKSHFPKHVYNSLKTKGGY